MKHLYLITPFLFTLSSILFSSDRVSTLVSPDQVLRLLIILEIFLALLMLPAYLITRDWEWASLLLTVLVFAFYFSPLFFAALGSLVLIVFVFWQAVWRLRGIKILLPQFFHLLNSIAFLSIGWALYLHNQSFSQVPWPNYFRAVNEAKEYSLKRLPPPLAKPDIYYIVLDGYLRSDMLRALYGFDNMPFTTFLQEAGFFVPEDIHSNYAKTATSVSSTLNMDYIDSFAPGLEDSHFWWLMEPFIDHSRVRSILESQGYTTVSLSTGWSMTDNPTTDIYLHPFPIMLTEYERYFLGSTALRYAQPLLGEIASIPTFETHRRVILHSFEALKNIPEVTGSKFVFAHIPAPHPPFVFDKNGESVTPAGHFNINDANDFDGSRSEYQAGYVGQLEFVNAQMQIVIDVILKQSSAPPIIVIQADHGSGLLTDFSSAENTCIKERFSPFAAYYLPGIDPQAVPQDLSTVNLFRVIFNEYFHANLPLLKNEQYYFRDTAFIFRLVNVTSRTDDECTIR
jgi:hypothetical protein